MRGSHTSPSIADMKRDRHVGKRVSLAGVKLSSAQLAASKEKWRASRKRQNSYSAWVRDRIGAVVEEEQV